MLYLLVSFSMIATIFYFSFFYEKPKQCPQCHESAKPAKPNYYGILNAMWCRKCKTTFLSDQKYFN